jgi:FMN phosphatase YigB (HAD superfamily)
MIRNIVFDLGNVLISFVPSEYLKKKNYPENLIKTILADIFSSPEWLQLDNGEINLEAAIDSIAGRSVLKRQEIALFFNSRTDIMYPLDENVLILPELNKRGFRLYYLSNFPIDIFPEVKESYSFFKYFSGGIISSEVNHSKPDVRIFRIFFEKFNLIPSECLYIDDIETNVRVAESFGMKVIHLTGTDSLVKKLAEQKIIRPIV